MDIQNVSAVTNDTFKNLIIGAGVLLNDFEYEGLDTGKDFFEGVGKAIQNGQCLGVTSGGININIEQVRHDLSASIDDVFAPFVGSEVGRRWNCGFDGTLKEVKKNVLQAVFPTAEFEEISSDVTEIKLGTSLQTNHHVKNTTWVARINQFGYLMISLLNALGRTNGAIVSNPDDSGNIPFAANGYLGAETLGAAKHAPCAIRMINMTNGAVQGASVTIDAEDNILDTSIFNSTAAEED
ncbi:MAG: hypothetical protein FWE19_00565 [Oscillospiraceae bacterium]|nr:hypothetical protein [Oscillospiraceae bacterium]